MRVSGFTIVKNATILQYPLVESILSILPIVDEYVVLIGKSDDDTVARVEAIGSPKIRILHHEWNDTVRDGGLYFSMLTNEALRECTGDWAFCLQADEVIHEKDIPTLVRLMEENIGRKEVKAISLRFLHFVGDYRTYNPYGHRKAERIVRNDGEVVALGDAVGFGLRDDPEGKRIQEWSRGRVVFSNVHIYHYSWVKDRRALTEKWNLIQPYYHGEKAGEIEEYPFDLRMVKRFKGTHPKVMEQRIAEFRSPLPPYPNRWLNPGFYGYLFRHGYKG